jgi:tetratricopeptide (TPR) repeat protein
MPATRSRATRHVIVVDNSHVARAIGGRIREARRRVGVSQAVLAKGRYTGAYISALERGLAKPSMAALTFIAERLGVAVRDLVGEDQPASARLEADVQLAAGNHAEALDRYDAILDTSRDRRLRAEALRGRAEALCRLGRGSQAIGPAAESAEIFGSLGAKADAAWAKYWLAYAHYEQDNPAEARSILHELLSADRAGLEVAPDFRFRLLTSLGHVEAWDGQTERALSYMEEARSLIEGLALAQRAAFLSGLALQYRHAGDLERAIRAGIESLALYRVAESEHDEAALLNNLALTYLALGNIERAAEHHARSREIADRLGDSRLQSELAASEAEIAFARGDRATAEERVAAAIAAAAADGGSYLAAVSAYTTRARMARRDGDLESAERSYASAADGLRAHGARTRLRDLLAEWAELREEAGDLAGANRLYAEAVGRMEPVSR